MQRGLTGHYVPLPSAAGEKARAFVPNPLPPAPPLEFDADIQELIQNAMLALGRLDGLTTVLPDPAIFLYSYNLSKRHLQDLRHRLRRFADAFQCEIHLIRPAQVQDFLTSLKLSPRSVKNFRMAISNLFAHARLRNHTPKDFDPLENIPMTKQADGEVEIYTPDELKSLLAAARPAPE